MHYCRVCWWRQRDDELGKIGDEPKLGFYASQEAVWCQRAADERSGVDFQRAEDCKRAGCDFQCRLPIRLQSWSARSETTVVTARCDAANDECRKKRTA